MTVLHQIPLSAITNDEISDAAFRLLCYIAHRSDDGLWEEETKKIMSGLHVSCRTYYRLKKELLDASLIIPCPGAKNHFKAAFSVSEGPSIPTREPEDFDELAPVSIQDRSLDHFQPFYEAYPRKIGRRAAEKAFQAAVKRGADPEMIVDRAAKFAQLQIEKETDPKFVPHPTTWLNQDRFDDEDVVKVNGQSTGDMAPQTL